MLFFFFQAEDGIRDYKVTGVQTCALPISRPGGRARAARRPRWPRARARGESGLRSCSWHQDKQKPQAEASREGVTQKGHARASHKDVARTGYLYGARVPTSDRRWLVSVTVPLTARVSFRSRYVPTNCVEAGIVKVTVIPSGFEVAYVPL